MIAQTLDHLWQSTVILCLAGLLTLLLRKNCAGARYWLPATNFSTVLLIIWGVGCGAVLLLWFIRWRQIRRTVSSAKPLSLHAPIPVPESRTLIEPGLVGIWRPVVLLPAGLAERLTPAEARGILAHELYHYRRRDNFTAAVHMLVEALFWFYPPIWWLATRLVAERERACDEAVLAAGNDAEVYAESILKVCRFFRHSALACTAGVSGGDLKRRVEEIMSGRSAFPVGRVRKLLVSISIAGALIGMALFAGLSAPAAQAQTSNSAAPTPADRAQLLAEQTRPQKEVPFNPTDFDKFAGYYKSREFPDFYARVYRDGDHFYAQLTGQPPVEEFPESPTEFFATVVAAQISFVSSAEGRVTEMVIHQNGFLRPWLRVSKSAYDAFETNLEQRIKENEPSPGTEAAVQRQIEEMERAGHALYAEMDAPLAAAAHEQEKQMKARFKVRGALESIRFSRVLPNGDDDYLVTFAHTQAEFIITPLSANGKISGMLLRDIP
jgi:beta-lactamase regulating signal transducer with metallopeptidase domain